MIWRPDHHCQASLADLVRYGGSVIEPDIGPLLRETGVRTHNYMEIESGAQFHKPILERRGDLCVRSIDTLVSPYAECGREQRFLRSLRASDAMRDLYRSVRPDGDVAAHVRMATRPAFDNLSWKAPANWPPHRHAEFVAWRRRSDAARFVATLDVLVTDGQAEPVFVVADLASTYTALIERFDARLRFLGGAWSSFSDMAQRLVPPGRAEEWGGFDLAMNTEMQGSHATASVA